MDNRTREVYEIKPIGAFLEGFFQPRAHLRSGLLEEDIPDAERGLALTTVTVQLASARVPEANEKRWIQSHPDTTKSADDAIENMVGPWRLERQTSTVSR